MMIIELEKSDPGNNKVMTIISWYESIFHSYGTILFYFMHHVCFKRLQ